MPSRNQPLPFSEKKAADSQSNSFEIILYTDPLCCWTWAMQPQLNQLLEEEAMPSSRIIYKMGGLLPSWQHFNDSVNSIQKPIQMGPEWMHARVLSGRKIDDKIWITDPPASSFPACIAVKSVELQSNELVPIYFNALQEAVMVSGQNIAKTDVLLSIATTVLSNRKMVSSNAQTALPNATTVSDQNAGFDQERFQTDLLGPSGKAAFREDLMQCKYFNIQRLPTIVFRTSEGRSLFLSGYQTYTSLKNALEKLH